MVLALAFSLIEVDDGVALMTMILGARRSGAVAAEASSVAGAFCGVIRFMSARCQRDGVRVGAGSVCEWKW
jgi:hypothetical protein